MTKQRFINVSIGKIVAYADRLYRISHIIGIDNVLGSDIETGKVERLRVENLSLPPESAEKVKEPDALTPFAKGSDLESIPTEEWQIAQQRYAAIQPLLKDPNRTRELAEQIANTHKIHVATLYRWLKLFTEANHISSLLPQKRGYRQGVLRLDESREKIVTSTIEDYYLTTNRQPVVDVIAEIKYRCEKAGLTPPHATTIRNRVKQLDAAYVLRRRGRRDKARDTYAPIKGCFPGANTPLAVVQMDHSESDIILVDEVTRLPIGRPWVTLAIDVKTRVIPGYYVSFDHPSAIAAGMCLSRAILPKNELLAELGVPGEWPVWGKMAVVHADNAREFRGAMLKSACKEYAIDLHLRPIKVPNYGGHIERFMGIKNSELKKLPGKTFSSPDERKGYDSDKHSALTLREFEQHLVDFLINIYHVRVHSELGIPPIKSWERGILGNSTAPGTGIPEVPADPRKLKLDFMPFELRTVQRYGIELDKIFYFHEVLIPWINATEPGKPKIKQKFIIRRDPRDISVVYFYDHENKLYYTIPYANGRHPAISLWELRAAQKQLRLEGQAEVDEEKIFNAVERSRTRVEAAIHKTKAARRHSARIDQTKQVVDKRQKNILMNSNGPIPPSDSKGLTDNTSVIDDIFAAPATPYKELWVKS